MPISIVKSKIVSEIVAAKTTTTKLATTIIRSFCYFFLLCCTGLVFAQASPDDFGEDDIEIVEGEDRTVYEYRTNGILMMIKIVPKVGRSYYMVPADGSAHFETLDHKKRLYPQWVIFEW